MIKLLIYWSDDDFNPSVVITDHHGAENLWWSLIGNPTLTIPVSATYAKRVVLFDLVGNYEIDPKKPIFSQTCQTYKSPVGAVEV